MSLPQKSVTLRPQPGGETTKSIRDMCWHWRKKIETTALISSVGVVPPGCAVWWFVLDAQLFLRPQLVSRRAQSDRSCVPFSRHYFTYFVTFLRRLLSKILAALRYTLSKTGAVFRFSQNCLTARRYFVQLHPIWN
jgi:hypothetical protein